MPILANATIISNFAAVGRLDILRALWQIIYIASPMYEELQRGADEGYTFLANLEIHTIQPDSWLRLVNLEGEQELEFYERAPAKLHRGEAMSLAIAAHRGWHFLTDDRAARLHAERMNVSVGGTIGTLVQAVRKRVVTLEQANTLLKQMIERAQYRSPITDLSNLLNEE